MSDSDTLTVRLPIETKEQLSRLAAHTNRTKSYLAGEAISAYVTRELEIVEGIERGMKDMKASRTVSHADAMARLRTKVKAVSKSKK
jgi:predicted transcriptional regulator